MKRLFATTLISAALALPALAQNLDALPFDELVKRAEAEGKVTVYSFTSRIAQVERAFEAAYPKIDVIALDINSTQMVARLQAESSARIRNADVAYISDPPVVFEKLVTPGVLQAYVPAAFKDRIPAAAQSPLLSHRLSTKVLMYNEEAHPGGAPIKNLWELTLPEWRGRVVMVDPSTRGDYLDMLTEFALQGDAMARAYQAQFGRAISLEANRRSAGEQWIADLFRNRVVLVNNTDAVNDAIGKKGQARPPIGFTTYSDRRDNARSNRALQIANAVEPSPGIVFAANLALVANAPNPAAARLLIHFMMGDGSATGGPAFAPFYVAGDYAIRTDIAPHPDAIPLAQLRAWSIDTQKVAAARQRIADLVLSLQ